MNAQVDDPYSVFVSNGEVFIADTGNHRVRKLLRNGQIVSIAGDGNKGYNGDDQLATDSQLYYPMGVVVSSSNQVYISEKSRIRKIDQRGIISTIAGTGEEGYNGDDKLAVDAQLSGPRGLFVTDDEEVYFCDLTNHSVRKIDRHGMISTIAGNGMKGYNGDDILATSAQLRFPSSVFVFKNEIYIADTGNHRIRKVLQNGVIKTIAGAGVKEYTVDDQPPIHSQAWYCYGIWVHNDCVYFSDHYNNRIWMILPNGMIKTIIVKNRAGNGSQFVHPSGIFVDDSGIYFCCNYDSRIRKVDPNGTITTIIGTSKYGYSGDVPFDFEKYPHIGPRKKQLIKPFPRALYDIAIQINK